MRDVYLWLERTLPFFLLGMELAAGILVPGPSAAGIELAGEAPAEHRTFLDPIVTTGAVESLVTSDGRGRI